MEWKRLKWQIYQEDTGRRIELCGVSEGAYHHLIAIYMHGAYLIN